MSNKISIFLGLWGFLFLTYFTISNLHRSDFAIFYFLVFAIAPHCYYIVSSKNIISKMFIVTLINVGLTFFFGGKSYWDFVLENIPQIVFGVTLISIIFLVTFVIKGFYDLKANNKILLERINELWFLYQPRVEIIIQLVHNLSPQMIQENEVVSDLMNIINQLGKIEEINSIVDCLDIIERRLKKLFMQISNDTKLQKNQTVAHLLSRLSLDEKSVQSGRIIYNHCANDYNESISYFPINIMAKMYNFFIVKKLKTEIAKFEV